MPALIVFGRRWNVGSDDLVVPGALHFTAHLIWAIILIVLLSLATFDNMKYCELQLLALVVAYLVIMVLLMAIELTICIVSMRGTILNTAPRASIKYILYFRVVVLFVEGALWATGVAWLLYKDFTNKCETVHPIIPDHILLSLIIGHGCVLLLTLFTIYCTYDAAGRTWSKIRKLRKSKSFFDLKLHRKRPMSRQRRVMKAYENLWKKRCRILFWGSRTTERTRDSFSDIARILTEFFRDVDIVPSDVVAGLVLLRQIQKIQENHILDQRINDTYEFLSGVSIDPRTRFLCLQEGGGDLNLFETVIHYAHFAIKAYGWPMYVMTSSMGLCRLCTNLRCCCCRHQQPEIVEDNCFGCNYAALQKLTSLGDIEIIYATYHVDVGETPFFVAIDYDRKNVVISIRGTLSIHDILTDLNAEGETLPLDPPREDWLGHKGMVQAAEYILEKLQEERLIERALQHCPERGTPEFEVVIVGHSLGAGIACILGILLRQFYWSLKCYCYSPPGGSLSWPAVEYTKNFTVSVVVGRDVVPRIGLNQMDGLKADLINAIRRSVDPKWKIITGFCCSSMEFTDEREYRRSRRSVSTWLYPPGRIIHVVRQHLTIEDKKIGKKSRESSVYHALWANNADFDKVLISPIMIQDHMPDKMIHALNKVLTCPEELQKTTNNLPASSNTWQSWLKNLWWY